MARSAWGRNSAVLANNRLGDPADRIIMDRPLFVRWSATRPANRVRGKIDRYCIWPGQACSYKIGHLEWLRAREVARAHAGGRFDLGAFHEILRRGSMPLAIVNRP